MACSPERSVAIGDLAGGRLDAERAGELLEHLEGCAACSAELDLVADVTAALAPAPERAAAAEAPYRPRLRIVPGLVTAAAAAIALVVLWKPTTDPGPSVADLANLQPILAAPYGLRSSTPETSARYQDAIQSYSQGEFEDAARGLSEVAAAEPENALANLYLGIAQLQVGALEEACTALRSAANAAAEPLLREQALWYLANANLSLERPDEARAVLQELEALEGDYQPNARLVLDALSERLRR